MYLYHWLCFIITVINSHGNFEYVLGVAIFCDGWKLPNDLWLPNNFGRNILKQRLIIYIYYTQRTFTNFIESGLGVTTDRCSISIEAPISLCCNRYTSITMFRRHIYIYAYKHIYMYYIYIYIYTTMSATIHEYLIWFLPIILPWTCISYMYRIHP